MGELDGTSGKREGRLLIASVALPPLVRYLLRALWFPADLALVSTL